MSDEAEIRMLLDERARITGERNAEAAVRYYSEDSVNFDLAPPLAYRGREASDPAKLQDWFDT